MSFRPDAGEFVGDVLLSSEMARVEHPYPAHRPESTVGLEHGIGVEYVEAAQAGSDGSALTDYDLIGSRRDGTGLFALDQLDRFDLLYLPSVARGVDTGPTAILASELYCRERGALLIADPRAEWEDPEAAVAGIREMGYASANMVSYFPRVHDARHSGSEARVVGGALAGMLSRLDANYGAWETLDHRGLGLKRQYRPAVEVDEEDQQMLERSGFNSWMSDATNRLRLIGDRTLARGTESHLAYSRLGVRRLCLTLVHAIDRSGNAVVRLRAARPAPRGQGPGTGSRELPRTGRSRRVRRRRLRRPVPNRGSGRRGLACRRDPARVYAGPRAGARVPDAAPVGRGLPRHEHGIRACPHSCPGSLCAARRIDAFGVMPEFGYPAGLLPARTNHEKSTRSPSRARAGRLRQA